MKPNIFNIATKELNQDAFITWLLKYADIECESIDILLNECGKTFVSELIRKQRPNFNDKIIKVIAERQWNNIDIRAKVNDKYLIIIEDKTETTHHSNQLTRYRTTAKEWCLKNNYEKPICIYLKTGNESSNSLKKIEKEGFAIFKRLDFIKLLSKYQTTKNDIFIDFFERLVKLEKSNNEFESKLISCWNGSDWQGFFQFLEKEINIVNWHYVNNQNGGFWNAVLNWDYWGIFPAYLQIEEGKLCFKISTDPEELDMPENLTRGTMRDKLHNLIIEKAKEFGLKKIRKPNRFGNGKYMTVAIVDRENWLGSDNSIIDKEVILKTLLLYINFLKQTIS